MRSFSHWTFHYVFSKLNYSLYAWRHPDHPWLTRESIQILSSCLSPEDQGFEWGSGRSTLWLAGRIKHLWSIEHDRAWYERMKSQLHYGKFSNVDLRFLNLLGDGDSEYVRSISSLENESLDFVLVDGRLRVFCLNAALDKIKPGGLLVLDNAEEYFPSSTKSPGGAKGLYRMNRIEIDRRLFDWRCIWTSNGIWDTLLWIKPPH